MEELPEDLRELWDKHQCKECPKGVYHISNGLVSKYPTDYGEEEEASKAIVEAALPSPWEQMLNVEDAMRQERNRNDRYTCLLQGIAVEFVEGLPTLPLTTSIDYRGKCSHFPGVYLIYYVGKTSLYGDLVSPSQDQPIYVGMSRIDILNNLKEHRKKVERAKDLEVKDFVVRFLTVDITQYASCIETMLIEYYSPLWNDPTVHFSFGNAGDDNNNWKKYHVAKDECTRKEMIQRVRMYYQGRITSA